MAKKNRLSNSHASSGSAKPKTTKAVEQARRMNAQKPKKKKGSTREYWKSVRTELGKVIWPTRKELGTYTVVVIATCAVFALGFWLIDTGVLAAMKAAFGVSLS